MLSAGSQADSAEKQLKLPLVPHFLLARFAAHRREAESVVGMALALRRLAAKLAAGRRSNRKIEERG
jgi:hypothetical protein